MRFYTYLFKLFTNALYWLFCLGVKIGTLIIIPFGFICYLMICLKFSKFIKLANKISSLLEAAFMLLECRFETSSLVL